MPLLPLIPVVLLLVMEPHMSGIVLTCAIVGTILLLGGNGGGLTWAGAFSAVVLLESVLQHIDSIPYLQSRLDGWTQDLSKMTDQTLQSLYAIGSGGLTGLGLGNSIEKQLWLPESTNDFIFSVVCEELGFLGALMVILLFVLFLLQGMWIAFQAENLYCTMVGIGIMAQIAWQVFCNIAVVTNTLPNTRHQSALFLFRRHQSDPAAGGDGGHGKHCPQWRPCRGRAGAAPCRAGGKGQSKGPH